jgi:hypothetical protein
MAYGDGLLLRAIIIPVQKINQTGGHCYGF